MSASVYCLQTFRCSKDVGISRLDDCFSVPIIPAQAIEIMNVALLEDTAPCEYVAPKDDPA